MNISCYGGKNEIGGNKILVEHKNTRIFLDFGISLSRARTFFSEFIQPRKSAGLLDFFELGLLPDIKGIYREDYLQHMGRPAENRSIDGIILSHAHADHAQYIHFIRNDVPIFCTRETKIILDALEVITTSQFNDLVTICDAFIFKKNKKGELTRVNRRDQEFVKKRPYIIVEPEKKIRIGSFDIEMYPVDHSVPGACGCILYSDEGNLVYTGDIRFHGYYSEKSRTFIQKAKEAHPKWLLCEGTKIEKKTGDSEKKLVHTMSSIIQKAPGLVFVEHPIRDLDRAQTIYSAAKDNHREFVVGLKLAYLIKALGSFCSFSLDDVLIFVPRKSWGLIDRRDIDKKLVEKDYEVWERELIQRKNVVTYHDVQNDQSRYVVSMNLWEITNLIDIQPKRAFWIKSSCEPFSDDMELDEKRKQAWLDHFHIKQFVAHASGHASGSEIKNLIREINPKKVIPVHTEHPELCGR
ncbi:MAG: MBL fold metallo-hydrolase [Candidatus Thermoplasmatota archaeon]